MQFVYHYKQKCHGLCTRVMFLRMTCAGDVDGSVEAILDILETYDSPHCQLHLLNYGVGNITESDIDMAATFDGNDCWLLLNLP